MAHDPQDNVDVTVDDELSDEVLGVVTGGTFDASVTSESCSMPRP
jgi:hypothetical protein